MRAMTILLVCLLSACSVNSEQSAGNRVRSFYSSYLMSLTNSDNEYPHSQLREYVSADTISRLRRIESIPEQDLMGSDYFTYVQDYDPSWIASLTVGDSKPYYGGEIMPVWIGIEDGKKLQLDVFIRREAGEWKIYRVRDVTDHYEHPIFDTGAITRAMAEAKNGI